MGGGALLVAAGALVAVVAGALVVAGTVVVVAGADVSAGAVALDANSSRSSLFLLSPTARFFKFDEGSLSDAGAARA